MVNNNENVRLNYIDNLKGFAIILVVWGHCDRNNYFYDSLYYIHLPIFIIVTGMLLSYNHKWDNPWLFIKKQLKGIMYPFYTFGIMSIIISLYLKYMAGMETDIKYRIKEILLLGYDACWYLPALFIGECIAILVIYITYKVLRKNYYIYLFLLLILGLSYVTKCLLWNFYGDYSQYQFIKGFNMWFLLIMSRSLFFSFYIMVGFIIFKFLRIIVDKFRILSIILSCIIFMIIIYITNKIGFVDLRLVNWSSTFKYLSCSLIGALSVIVFFMAFNKRIRILEFLGKNSLIIMGVHLSFKVVTLVNNFTYDVMPSFLINFPTICTMLITFIILILCIPYIYIFNKAFPFLINLNNLKYNSKCRE